MIYRNVILSPMVCRNQEFVVFRKNKAIFYGLLALAVIASVYSNNKEKLSGSYIKSIFEKEEPVDEFVKLANQKQERLFELVELQKYNVNVRGRIIRGLNWTDFPGLADEVVKLHPDGDQLLQVFVGEPAMLVTRKTSFSTTGYFNMVAQKYTQWDTTMGKVWVLIEYPEGKEQEEELNQIEKDMNELTMQYLENNLSKYLEKSIALKNKNNSALSLNEIAGLQLLKKLGETKGEASNIFIYLIVKSLVLCDIQKQNDFNATTWAQEFDKIYQGDEHVSSKISYCANGGPFKDEKKVLTFKQCMCGNGKPASKKLQSRYESILNQINTTNNQDQK